MDKKFACYCGLYCGNCAVKVKVEPAARVLYDEMKAAGFEDVISFIPGGEGFWPFLKGIFNPNSRLSLVFLRASHHSAITAMNL